MDALHIVMITLIVRYLIPIADALVNLIALSTCP